jgi:hypothetical protein
MTQYDIMIFFKFADIYALTYNPICNSGYIYLVFGEDNDITKFKYLKFTGSSVYGFLYYEKEINHYYYIKKYESLISIYNLYKCILTNNNLTVVKSDNYDVLEKEQNIIGYGSSISEALDNYARLTALQDEKYGRDFNHSIIPEFKFIEIELIKIIKKNNNIFIVDKNIYDIFLTLLSKYKLEHANLVHNDYSKNYMKWKYFSGKNKID